MGADLYIDSVFMKQRAEWKPKFDAALKAREEFQKANPVHDWTLTDELAIPEALLAEWDQLDNAVAEAYEGMNKKGYFRDSYNASSLLWKLGLSWWGSFDGLTLHTDDGGTVLPVANIPTVIRMVESAELRDVCADDVEYFTEKRKRLVAFLNEALALNAPIAWFV